MSGVAPRVLVLAIGEELLRGQVQDANSAWLARQLLELGCAVENILVVGDHPEELAVALRSQHLCTPPFPYDGIVTSGGLGPTADDRVREVVAGSYRRPLEDVPEAVQALRRLWGRQRGGHPPGPFLAQGRVPRGARPLKNPAGTAWGFALRVPEAPWIVCLPGPPRECRATFVAGGGRAAIREWVGDTPGVLGTSFHVAGLPESAVEERVRDLIRHPGNPRYGITASADRVSVSAWAFADGRHPDPRPLLEEAAARIRERLGDLAWGRDEETLPEVVLRLCRQRGVTLATAESCTGGRLAAAITSVPGASRSYLEGWVTYANEAKIRELGVSSELLARRGAVSAEVALAMATGARARSGAEWALATTGIAGPGGGSPEKPVGTVWLGIAGPTGAWAVHRRAFARAGRTAVQDQAVRDALEALRRELLGLERLPERR